MKLPSLLLGLLVAPVLLLAQTTPPAAEGRLQNSRNSSGVRWDPQENVRFLFRLNIIELHPEPDGKLDWKGRPLFLWKSPKGTPSVPERTADLLEFDTTYTWTQPQNSGTIRHVRFAEATETRVIIRDQWELTAPAPQANFAEEICFDPAKYPNATIELISPVEGDEVRKPLLADYVKEQKGAFTRGIFADAQGVRLRNISGGTLTARTDVVYRIELRVIKEQSGSKTFVVRFNPVDNAPLQSGSFILSCDWTPDAVPATP